MAENNVFWLILLHVSWIVYYMSSSGVLRAYYTAYQITFNFAHCMLKMPGAELMFYVSHLFSL